MKTQNCCSHFLNSYSLFGWYIMKTKLKNLNQNNIWDGGAHIKQELDYETEWNGVNQTSS